MTANNYLKEKRCLVEKIDKIHLTFLSEKRIKKNLRTDADDILLFCKTLITDKSSSVIKKGKNYYVSLNGITLTVNASTFTVITAHKTN